VSVLKTVKVAVFAYRKCDSLSARATVLTQVPQAVDVTKTCSLRGCTFKRFRVVRIFAETQTCIRYDVYISNFAGLEQLVKRFFAYYLSELSNDLQFRERLSSAFRIPWIHKTIIHQLVTQTLRTPKPHGGKIMF
jgi:hypothetical protein